VISNNDNNNNNNNNDNENNKNNINNNNNNNKDIIEIMIKSLQDDIALLKRLNRIFQNNQQQNEISDEKKTFLDYKIILKSGFYLLVLFYFIFFNF
jgi:UV DNA damage repair endonuclease